MYSRRTVILKGALALPAIACSQSSAVETCMVHANAVAQSTAPSSSSAVTTFDLPVEVTSNRYKVEIDGKQVPVFRATLNTHFVSFDCAGTVTVSVSLPEHDYWSKGAFVRPLVRNIYPKIDGNTISFQVTAPAKLAVECSGIRGLFDEALFLFANLPVSSPLPASSSEIIALPAGVHRRNIDLKSGQTLYLEGGAVLIGSVNVWDAENATILGRGAILYDGPQSTTHDEGWNLLRNWRPISINNSRNIRVSGITCITRSRTWSIQTVRSENLRFENINIISANTANVNGDGMDFMGCDHAVIDSCFIRCCDDAFAFYGDFIGAKAGLPPRDTVTDIKISRCVFWVTRANILRVGWINSSPQTRDISLRDCDVIHLLEGGDTSSQAGGTDSLRSPYALLHIWVPVGKTQSIHENYLFEDIRLEDYSALIGSDAPSCLFRNFLFRNITASRPLQPSIFRGKLDPAHALEFQNVKVGGVLLNKAEDIPLKVVDSDPIGVTFAAN